MLNSTLKNSRIPSLDGFRALSILLVLICHARLSEGFPQGLVEIAKRGEVGVTFFFVISGFLITTLLKRGGEKRVYLHTAFLSETDLENYSGVHLYAVFIFFWQHIENLNITNANWIHTLTFTANFENGSAWMLGHSWTLSAALILLFVYLPPTHLLAVVVLPFGNTIISASFLMIVLSYIAYRDNFLFKILNNKIFIHNLLFIYAAALVSYNLIEKPFLNFKRYLVNPQPENKSVVKA